MQSPSRQSLFITWQRMLPAFLLGRLVHRISRSEIRWLKNLLIRGFVAMYRVNVSEAAQPAPFGYSSFNAFFTRSLRPDARPIDADVSTAVSPADGTIQQIGEIRGQELLQVKGINYSLSDLLGDVPAAQRYQDGSFLTVYLAPYNYHRVHMPLDGHVRQMVYVPGARWSVNARTVAAVPGLFARNERLICHCEGPAGEFVVILVGAMNVGSINVAWAGEILPRTPRRLQRWDYKPDDSRTHLAKGEGLGHFNLGSTVILLVPRNVIRWKPDLGAGQEIQVGAALGHLTTRTMPAS